MKKILVPIDFSETSLHALRLACQLAVRVEAAVCILHSYQIVPYDLPVSEYAFITPVVDPGKIEQELSESMQQLKEKLQQEPRFSGLQISTRFFPGPVIPTILQLAEEEAADLIVMGTMGAGGWKEMAIGSNTEHIIRHAPCPVLVVPENAAELQVERVLVPTTLHPDQEKVFEIVKLWQDVFGFDVEALFVGDPFEATPGGNIEAEKNRLIEAVGLRHVYLHLNTTKNKPENVIRKYADEAGSDLVIMGTHQRHGIAHLLFGSMTENTANHSKIPVLAIPIR